VKEELQKAIRAAIEAAPSSAEWLFAPSYGKTRRKSLVRDLWEAVGAEFRGMIRARVISGETHAAMWAVGFDHNNLRVICMAEFLADEMAPDLVRAIVGPREFIEAEEEKLKGLAVQWGIVSDD
jgi:hypothetical protein